MSSRGRVAKGAKGPSPARIALFAAAALAALVAVVALGFRAVRGSGGGHAVELLEVSEDGGVGSGQLVPIDKMHLGGLPHRGIWIFVVNQHLEVLLVHRAATMKTCASTWSIVGEHSTPGEALVDTAARGLDEELHLVGRSPLPLEPEPVFLHLEYGDGRVDNQWTQMFYVRVMQEDVVLDPEEARGMMWLPLEGWKTWVRDNPSVLCQEIRNAYRERKKGGEAGGRGGREPVTYERLLTEGVDSLLSILGGTLKDLS